ncbi:MAG TPA: response regulator [Candidatus Limnocylindria bacterium]|jgi:CheY-like chemotaxis protein|nr:response regulator [Candidatus Limnocylindria bacterium]
MPERILLVDDRPANLRLLEAVLSPYGYSISTASSGEDALRLIADQPPDLIQLDVVMPGMKGYEVCRRIRADAALRSLPIVMVTSNPQQDKVAAIDAGADDFIVEPYDKHELLARVRSLLRIKSYHDANERQAAELAELNRTLEQRVATQVAEILALRGLGGMAMFRREGEFWTIAFKGSAFRLKDSKGLQYIARLLSEPGREVHALALLSAPSAESESSQHAAGDAGPVLDAEAKQEYRTRLEQLEAELREAEEWNDAERAAQAREEREMLAHELAAAVGLGGRDRRAASDAERARISVTRTIKAALERIAEHGPELGEHFETTLRTGTFCVYLPDPGSPIRWQL